MIFAGFFPLQAFLSVGASITAELTDVRLLSPVLGSVPRLLHEASVAQLIVPEKAANSEVSCVYIYIFFFFGDAFIVCACRHLLKSSSFS